VRRAARLLGLVPALALLAGCDTLLTGGTACPMWIPPSLQVEVVDAVSGANLAPGAEGWWVRDDFTGRLEGDGSQGYLIAHGGVGRHSVIVQHPGYAAWGRDDIRVRRGECGPVMVTVRAEMVRDGTLPSLDGKPAGR
jgi:hypothetical protein